MYLAMVSHIIFDKTALRSKVEIRRISSCKIESSWSSLTSTAEIVLPYNVLEFRSGIRDMFRRGDPVEIRLGYNGKLVTEFVGYISEVSATIPVVIKCEDDMIKLKDNKVNLSYKAVNLQQLAKDIAPGYTIDAADVDLGTVRFQKTTSAAVLQYLKDKLKIHSYFRGKTLVVGKIYSDDTAVAPVKLDFRRDVVSDSSLTYRHADDQRIKVEVVSYLKGGKTVKAESGDPDGVESRFVHYGITDEKKLKALADGHVKALKKDGYSGSLTAFGIPVVNHGQKVTLYDPRYTERSGTYYVDTTVLTFSDSPSIRRDITIGRRAV